MLYPIKNNEKIVARSKNLLMLFNGSITIEIDNELHVIPSRRFFFFDRNFDIIAASPFVEGFVAYLTNENLISFPDLGIKLSQIQAQFVLSDIKNAEDKKNKVGSLLDTINSVRLSESYAHILWSEFINDYTDHQRKKSTVEKFSVLIDQNIEQNYCAGTYAEMMGIPLKRLIREVRKEEDKTPCNFITDKVIQKAKYKLLHTEDTSQMIAYQLGFEDPYYFIKYFKKNTDLTPTQFRAKNNTSQ